jgi:hypothetical protein
VAVVEKRIPSLHGMVTLSLGGITGLLFGELMSLILSCFPMHRPFVRQTRCLGKADKLTRLEIDKPSLTADHPLLIGRLENRTQKAESRMKSTIYETAVQETIVNQGHTRWLRHLIQLLHLLQSGAAPR